MSLLAGIRVVSLAINLPGPRTMQRLAQMGAQVTNVEPPYGDPLAKDFPELYRRLHRDQRVVALNLRSVEGKTELFRLLAEVDVLLTSSRPRTLARLGLGWEELHARFPRLCQVAIVGHASPEADRAGHDLTYQAAAGLLDPPQMPRALIADEAGAERAVSAALALLFARQRDGTAGYAEVALTDAAAPYAEALRAGATREGGMLGGGLPQYGLYPARAGWIAFAALEYVFIEKFKKAFDLNEITRKSLSEIFLTRTAREWEDWGKQEDIPIAAVNRPEQDMEGVT